MPFPFGNKVRAHFGAAQAAVSSASSCVELQAHPDGSGILISLVLSEGFDGGFRMTDATVLDANEAVVTPEIVSDPSHTFATVIRTGSNSVDNAAAPDFMLLSAQGRSIADDIFVPPGKFFTVLTETDNDALAASICFDEFLDTPGSG